MNESPQSSNGRPANGIDLKNLNWPTVILILVTGGGNLWATHENSTQRQYQVDQALQQIRDLHNALDDFETRQKKLLEGIDTGLKNQTQMLKNQNEILEEFHKANR